MKMFLKEQVRSDDPVLQRVYASFGRNLSDIISLGKRPGVKTIVCSVSSNLRDCPPFASLRWQGLPEARKVEWTNRVQKAIESESGGQFSQALAQYRQAAEIEGGDALLTFRLARCCQAAGESEAALQQYLRAAISIR